MKPWWLIAQEVENLRGKDGGPFRDFMNDLIHVESRTIGISASQVSTDSRNMRDGGVDCEVKASSAGGKSGYLNVKSVWQFKGQEASAFSPAKLREEVTKPYVVELIKAGYGYRFCIGDQLTAEKETEWLGYFSDEIRKINPTAPAPMILTSTKIAEWANAFPGIVAQLRPQYGFQHLRAWEQSVRSLTQEYVSVPAWSDIQRQIIAHLDFKQNVSSVIFPIHGDAGVGKTRLVFESVASIPGAKELTVYRFDDQEVINFAGHLASNEELFAILIIDECSADRRLRIDDLLRAHRNRVRAISIDNQKIIAASGQPEPNLEKMAPDVVEVILEKNFPGADLQLRRAAVHLSGGFVKIAADICAHGLPGAANRITDYYYSRIPDGALRRVIQALSLCTRIGFKDDLASQLEALCNLVGLNKTEFLEHAQALKRSPGFVAVGGRYLYVTPEAIAQAALSDAWSTVSTSTMIHAQISANRKQKWPAVRERSASAVRHRCGRVEAPQYMHSSKP